MKKIFILIILTFSIFSLFSAERISNKTLKDFLDNSSSRIRNYQPKNYEFEISKTDKFLKTCKNLSDYDKQRIAFYQAKMYACLNEYCSAIEKFNSAKSKDKDFNLLIDSNIAFLNRDYYAIEKNLSILGEFGNNNRLFFEVKALKDNYLQPYWKYYKTLNQLSCERNNESNFVEKSFYYVKDSKLNVFDYSSENAEITTKIPIIFSKSDKLVQEINVPLYDETSERVHQFNQDISDLSENFKAKYIIDYELLLSDKDFICINFYEYSYTGGAHGNSSSFEKIWDFNKQKFISVKDVFNQTLKNNIVEYIYRILDSRNTPYFYEDSSNFNLTYTTINLTEEGLFIVIDPYQVAPYSSGTIKMLYPYNLINLDNINDKNIRNFIKKRKLITRIKQYSAHHAKELIALLLTSEKDFAKDLFFLLDNCSNSDLAIITPEYLKNNIQFSQVVREFEFAKEYSDEIFQHFVLPYRVSQEPLENWREDFFAQLYDKVKDISDIEKAAIIVNLWALEQMTFKQTNGRDQAPITTIKRGYGRCEEMMILYIAAARAVGIPARTTSVPYWNFTDNNHAWVEIWTPDGWKYLGEAENSLNKAWFSKTTERATLITSRAFGNFKSKDTIKQKNKVTTISSIRYYTDFENCIISVNSSDGKPATNAKVTLYAASYGGLFAMTKLSTNSQGFTEIPLGKGTVYVTAYKDSCFAKGILNTINGSTLDLTLGNNTTISEDFIFQFPIKNSTKKTIAKSELLGKEFYALRDSANSKRKQRLDNLRSIEKILPFFDDFQITEEKINKNETFAEQIDLLAENSDDFLTVLKANSQDKLKTKIIFNMLKEWDIKDLIEIPDSTMIQSIVNIFAECYNSHDETIPDSIFYKNVVGLTWHSANPPQNGWQKNLKSLTERLHHNKIKINVKNILEWISLNLSVDKNFNYTYFTGELNPIEIINLEQISDFQRVKVLNSMLKLSGIPVQWKGRLEFYDGESFLPIENENTEENPLIEGKTKISIYVDGKQVKAEPWNNFLLSSLTDDGVISNCYFDGENDSLDYIVNYKTKENRPVYLQSFIRNDNGDAHFKMITLQNNEDKIIQLQTPSEYIDLSNKWHKKTLQSLKKLLKNEKIPQIIFVRGNEINEPQQRMLEQILDKNEDFIRENVQIIVYTEKRNSHDLKSLPKNIVKKNGKKRIHKSESLDWEEYPIIFLFNSNKELIFSSKGYNMGISDLLIKKVKNSKK